MKIRPLGDRIIVQRSAEKTMTDGGLHIPSNAQERPVEGKVIAIGSGKRLDDGSLLKPDLAEGDKVLFSRYSGTEVQVDGVEHLILREDEILGIIG
jgi:chaperonin GroES